MNRLRTAAIWLLLVAVVLALGWALEEEPAPPPRDVATFLRDVDAGAVTGLRYVDDRTEYTLADGTRWTVAGTLGEADWERISEAGIPWQVDDGGGIGSSLLVTVLPVVLLVAALVYFIVRQRARASDGGIFTMRRSTARLVKAGEERLRFDDVGGAAEAKAQLADVVDYLRHPERWTSGGVRLPRGVLLEGPPGCGKTLLARAVAGEAGVPVFVVSASEFVEMFVGVGAARVRDLFATAAKSAPAVVFIDELDAVGRRRGSGIGASHDEREQTLNQLLVSLDGFEKVPRVVVIAATNRADVLDRALLRPGRFDVRVRIAAPDAADRAAVLRIHTRGKPLASDVDLDALAARTEGFTGADLEHVCNEAAMVAVRRARGGGDAHIGAADFAAVLDRREAAVTFDRVDQLLLESASQLAQPSGPTRVHVALLDGTTLEGSLVWADATFLKLQTEDGAHILPKARIDRLRALAGTGAVGADETVGDAWAGRRADTA